MHAFGVSQKAVIVDKYHRLLTLYRTETAPTRPDTWDLPGGDMDFGKDAFAGIKREIKEETGLSLNKVEPYDVDTRINGDGDFWVTIAYKAEYTRGKVVLSPEHNQFRWVTPEEFLNLESADKLKRFVSNLVILMRPH